MPPRTGRAAAWLKHGIAKVGRPAVYAALAVLVLSCAAAAYWFFGSSGTVSYVTAPVSKGTVARAITATGAINPVLTITVGSYVSGVIQQIACDFNTKVKKGQLCAKIDPRPYQTIVEQDRASVDSANAQLVKDQANLAYAAASERRYANLLALNAMSRDTYEVALNARRQAQAQVALDQSAIRQRIAVLGAAQVNVGYTDIVSPVDGTVVSRNVTMGQTVAASFQTPTLFLIATDLAKMQVDTNVSEGDVGSIRVGEKAQFRVEAYPDRTFDGVVTQVRQAPQSVQNVITYDVIVAVANPQLFLKPGMTATVRIFIETRDNVRRVPSLALRYTPGGLAAASDQASRASPQLWVLRKGRAVRVPVVTGLDDDAFVEIKSGDIRDGDQVIVSERSASGAKRNSAAPSLRFP